jgi:predicted ester cyclase
VAGAVPGQIVSAPTTFNSLWRRRAWGRARLGLQVTIEHVVAEADKVDAHVSVRGKHTGELMGIPPSGKDVVMRVSDLVRIEDGKAVERWGVEDISRLMS